MPVTVKCAACGHKVKAATHHAKKPNTGKPPKAGAGKKTAVNKAKPDKNGLKKLIRGKINKLDCTCGTKVNVNCPGGKCR